MNLNVERWETFNLCDLFDVSAGIYYYQDDYLEGNTPYCSASAENNGVSKKIDIAPDFSGNKIITGKVGCAAFYQRDDFCATSDVNVLTPKFNMSSEIGIFITTVINKNENYRWNYGRQCRVGNTKKITIKLPVLQNKDGTPFIDIDFKYSSYGFIPDWQFMENYIKSLRYKKVTTNIRKSSAINLNTDNWKEFFLHRIFNAEMGNGIDAVVTTDITPKYNYVGRSANDNGVAAFIDEIEGVKPYPAGAITLSLGGSLGACFIQTMPFYTAQNVAVLQEKVHLSNYVKLFILTVIKNECKIKYQAFGRELNAHYKKDFTLKLPVKHGVDGEIITDKDSVFSDEGYVPDWQWMEDYIKSLPYSDRI
jgi:hypothetical protein